MRKADADRDDQTARLRIAVVHVHPVERYPPVTNAIDYFGGQKAIELLVVTVDSPPNMSAYENRACEIRRIPFRDPNGSTLGNAVLGFAWHWKAARLIASWKPDVIFYWDPQSALACYLCLRWMGCKSTLLVHHHEYHAPEDFLRVGMRIPRLGHYFERNWLFRRASWISQTNADRLHLFRHDVPDLREEQIRVMPNYPPASWLKRTPATWTDRQLRDLRLVYVGSLSLDDTFIGPLVSWLVANPDAGVTLDVFSNNCESRTLEFLRAADGAVVRLHEDGVDYNEIPDVLAEFDVGLVLYRCRTKNYQYNASNKLFEYLICGLDVWFPPTMLGVKPYARNLAWPRVIEVDFENLDALDLGGVRSRAGLPHIPWTETCESQLEILEDAMRRPSETR